MKQRIFILWASGNVGRELISQVLRKDVKGNHVNPSEIVGIANSDSYIFDEGGVSLEILEDISSSRNSAISCFSQNSTPFDKIEDIVDIVKNAGLDWEIVFADVTAWKQELLDLHKKILLESQNFLVTANKNPISLYSQTDFNELTTYARRYDTNTTVMGWAGILNFVHERTNGIADNIHKIEGVFSWTLWYILSELEKQEKTFSQIVRDAKEQWYTEPNPWDDLNWLDVARKLVILARYAWHEIDITDVQVNPLVWLQYAQYSGEEFLNQLENEDASFSTQASMAESQWKVLRYVAKMNYAGEKLSLEVWLMSVLKNSDLGTLDGTSNLALISTDILSEPLPHVIKSRGAGLAVTAGAVRVWISKMLSSHLLTR